MSSLTGLKKADGQRGTLRRAAMLAGTTPLLNTLFRHGGRAANAVLDVAGGALNPVPDLPHRELVVADSLRARLYGEGDRLLVYFHGGGFVLGSLVSHAGLARFVAATASCKVLAVDYRLAPAHPFPAAHDDAAASVRWVLEHADDLGVDPAKVVVGGDSAGANLAIAACLTEDVEVRGAWLLCPVTDGDVNRYESARLFARGPLLSRRGLIDALGNYARGPRELLDPRLAAVDRDDLDRMPPAYVATAGMDVVRDQGERFAGRLEHAEAKRFPNLPHSFYTLLADPESRAATTECCAALDRLLG